MAISQPIIFPGMPSFKVEALAVVISGIAYGMAVILFFSCFWLVRQNSHEKRTFLLTYISIMISLSTGAMIQEIVFMMRNILAKTLTNPDLSVEDLATLKGIPLTTPFIIWGADGLLIWRCIVLYQGASSRARMGLYIVLCLVILLSFAGDIILFFTTTLRIRLSPGTGLFMIAISAFFCNGILSGLIASRIFFHGRFLRRVTGSSCQEWESGYRHVVSMCIESSFLIVAVSAIFITFAFTFRVFALYICIPGYLLPHICVISPLLILLRVAQGKAFSYQQEAAQHQVSDIRFNSVFSTQA